MFHLTPTPDGWRFTCELCGHKQAGLTTAQAAAHALTHPCLATTSTPPGVSRQ